MNNRIRRIESYEEYKVEIASWLIKNISNVPAYMMVDEVKYYQQKAENNELVYSTVIFQDETIAHFNHDIAKLCKAILGA